MSLSVGNRLGPYVIVAPSGAGGMGEVYRARDTKLDREVAIKVLPAALAQHPDRPARFEREAKVLAALNHPNIAIIHGLEDRVLVMEFVEGESSKRPLLLDEAWHIATQIAAALDYAHERGHRDLKPANVKVTRDGVVKLLDFGFSEGVHQSARSFGRFGELPNTDDGRKTGPMAESARCAKREINECANRAARECRRERAMKRALRPRRRNTSDTSPTKPITT